MQEWIPQWRYDEAQAEKDAVYRALQADAENWSEILGQPVTVEFASEPYTTVTGVTYYRDWFNGPDDYWLDVWVGDDPVRRFSSYRAALTWVEEAVVDYAGA